MEKTMSDCKSEKSEKKVELELFENNSIEFFGI